MKKSLTILLIAIVLLLSLFGCGSSKSDSSVMSSKVITEEQLSGTGDKIGEYHYIEMDIDDAKAMTSDQFGEFCNKVVEEHEGMRFVVDFENGYGLNFPNCNTALIQYGKLDSDKLISETIGTIQRTDGEFIYTEN